MSLDRPIPCYVRPYSWQELREREHRAVYWKLRSFLAALDKGEDVRDLRERLDEAIKGLEKVMG